MYKLPSYRWSMVGLVRDVLISIMVCICFYMGRDVIATMDEPMYGYLYFGLSFL